MRYLIGTACVFLLATAALAQGECVMPPGPGTIVAEVCLETPTEPVQTRTPEPPPPEPQRWWVALPVVMQG